MKKATGSILTAAVCVGLSLSAFTLPATASSGLKTGAANVMEKETPQEYMADFSVAEIEPGMQEDRSKYKDTVFISESQVESLKKNTEKFLLEAYGVKIPQDFAFEYYTVDFDGITIYLDWFDGSRADIPGYKAYYRDVVYFSAVYEITGLHGSTLNTVLKQIDINNGYDTKLLENLKNQSLKALKDELGVDVPENYSVFNSVTFAFDDGRQTNAAVNFQWADDTRVTDADNFATRCYSIGFDKVNFSENTGRLIWVEDNVMRVNARFNNNTVPDLTEEQVEELLEAAKQFLAGKGITAENLMSRGGAARKYKFDYDYNGGKVLLFLFEQVEKNDSASGYIQIFITQEFDVLGYSY